MKRLLFIILTICSFHTMACRCFWRSIDEEIKISDLIFRGVVIGIETKNDSNYFSFKILKTWKGYAYAFSIIASDNSFCGANFLTGDEVIVFSAKGKTNHCRRNTKVTGCNFIGILNFTFDQNYRGTIGKDSERLLNENEAYYFNSIFPLDSNGVFNFRKKRIAFFEETKISDKKAFFENYGTKEFTSDITLLNQKEKAILGYDAIIMSGIKKRNTRKLKAKLVKQLQKEIAYH